MKSITSLDISKKFNRNLTASQHKANANWIEMVGKVTREGGYWVYPNANKTFKRVGDHWVEV